MRISWKWLSEMVDLGPPGGPAGTPEKLAELLTRRGLEVEAVERQGHGFEKVVTAQILARGPHPQADRLSLCQVSLGPEPGNGEPLEIVCGAQNMKAGDKVALAQVGAHLPNGAKIERSKIRGVVSSGMLCSEEELCLKERSEGILILPPETPLGRPLAEILGLDDTILVFKLTANRGDCLSHYGMAREVAAALGRKPRRPEARELPWKQKEKASPVSVFLEAGELAPQFFGVLMEGVQIGPSPAWVVKRLEGLGSRSINNVVDATNLVMLELGQPVHAYDADRIEGGRIGVRMAEAGAELPLLDGKTITLSGTELVISDGRKAVGLAGVMGGGNSEVRDSTTRLFLECAEFDPTLVRRASSRHQRKSDAAHRFERGVDPLGLPHAVARLATLVQELAGGEVRGVAVAQLPSRQPFRPRELTVSFPYFERFLGMPLEKAEAERILVDLGCQVSVGGGPGGALPDQAADSWRVTVPSWRWDLSLRQDLAEELARSMGYDRIRETVPPLTSPPRTAWEGPSVLLLDRAKDALVAAGLCEALNYSFASKAWLSRFGISPRLGLINPLSEEHEVMVPSLLPGLIRNALDNWHHHFGSEPLAIRLFELRPTFHLPEGARAQASGEMETGVEERWKLAFALSGPRFASGLRDQRGEVDFFDLKAVVESLFSVLGTRGTRFVAMRDSAEPGHAPVTDSRKGEHSLFHPGQSVEVLAGSEVAGAFGLIHPGKARELKLRAPLWIGEIDWQPIARLSRPVVQAPAFKPLPQFPPMERDFALVVGSGISADKIAQVALKAGKPLAKVAKIFDVYRGPPVAEGMTSVAVRVIFYDESRSLQEQEAEAASAQILAAWKKELGAELR